MTGIRERFNKWKEGRNKWQKAGDMVFWVLLVLLLIPGPRKTIITGLNSVTLHLKNPRLKTEEKHVQLEAEDFQWSMKDAEGTSFRLEDFKGEVIFLNYWATWCPPCVAELPEIQKAFDKHGDKVRFLLLTLENPARVDAFMARHDYKLPVYYGNSDLPDKLKARGIPTTFIIDRNGCIVSKKTGAANWDSRATDRIFEALLK